MVMNGTAYWLVAYDIADPYRLCRIHRHLTRAAIPLQYSLFVLTASRKKLDRLRDELEGLIDSRADDVRIYLVPVQPKVWILGRQPLPDDAHLLGKDERDLWYLLKKPQLSAGESK